MTFGGNVMVYGSTTLSTKVLLQLLVPFSIPGDLLLIVVPGHAPRIAHANLRIPSFPCFFTLDTLDSGTPFEQAREFGTAGKVWMISRVRVPEEAFDR